MCSIRLVEDDVVAAMTLKSNHLVILGDKANEPTIMGWLVDCVGAKGLEPLTSRM